MAVCVGASHSLCADVEVLKPDVAGTRERKWKLNMAKKYVRAVARSNLDLESRKNVRQKEAELAIRRRAAFIGKEVSPSHVLCYRKLVYLSPVLCLHAIKRATFFAHCVCSRQRGHSLLCVH